MLTLVCVSTFNTPKITSVNIKRTPFHFQHSLQQLKMCFTVWKDYNNIQLNCCLFHINQIKLVQAEGVDIFFLHKIKPVIHCSFKLKILSNSGECYSIYNVFKHFSIIIWKTLGKNLVFFIGRSPQHLGGSTDFIFMSSPQTWH